MTTWRYKAKTFTGETVFGSLFEKSGFCFLITDVKNNNADVVIVDKNTLCKELGVFDMNNRMLYENDYLKNPKNGEVYYLKFNREYPYSAIHPFFNELFSKMQYIGNSIDGEVKAV